MEYFCSITFHNHKYILLTLFFCEGFVDIINYILTVNCDQIAYLKDHKDSKTSYMF